MKILSHYYLITILLIASCNPEKECDDMVRWMKFVDRSTDHPVAGAEVLLMKDVGNGWGIVEKHTTGENGVVWWFCSNGAESICASKEGYHDFCGSGDYIQSFPNNIYEMNPKAWLRVTVTDVEPLNPEIVIKVRNSRGQSFMLIPSIQSGHILDVIGNYNNPVTFVHLTSADLPALQITTVQVQVPPGDTLSYNYTY